MTPAEIKQRIAEIRARRVRIASYAPAPWSARYEEKVGGLVLDKNGAGLVHLHDEHLTNFFASAPADIDFFLSLAKGKDN